MTGSWKGRGNQYIQFVRVLYCKLPTNGKQLPAFPLEAVLGIEPQSQRWEARVLPLCHCGPLVSTVMLMQYMQESLVFIPNSMVFIKWAAQFGQFIKKEITYWVSCLFSRLSPSPFVFCEICGYCMTFEETASPDKRNFLTYFRE